MTKIWEKVITDALTDEAIKIAKNLLKKSLSLEDIADATELDIETIKDLQEQVTNENDIAGKDS